jgi:hypothetical protein
MRERSTGRWLAAMLLACPVVHDALAVEAPPGWRKLTPQAGGETFVTGTRDDRLELALSRIEAGDGQALTAWLDERMVRDAASFDTAPACQPSRMAKGGAQASCTLGPTARLTYAAIQGADGRRRIARIHAAGAPSFAAARADTLTRLLREGMEELALPSAPTAAGPAPQPARQAVRDTPVPAGNEQVETVAMLGTYRMNGVGGMLLFQYQPIVLYVGGHARDSERSPDLADERTRGVRHGHWRISGKQLQITWSDGKRSESSKWNRCRPATGSYRLQGRYSALQGGGNTALGGTDSLAVSTSYSFDGQGGYTLGRAVGSQGRSGDSSTVTSAQGRSGGRYVVSGYALRLEPEDGEPRSLLFCRYPDGEKAVFIGRTSFLRDEE